jgi:hypothetical protein
MSELRIVCAICGKPLNLEEAKVDAVGMPVHEDCYVSAMAKMVPHLVTPRNKAD